MSWFSSEALSVPTVWYEPTSWWGGVWPLFCETDRAVDCFTSGRFLPIAILHAVLYYGGLLTVLLLKRAGRYPRLPGADATWNKASFVGWHVPNIVNGGAYGYIALCLAWELWLSGDAQRMWGPLTQRAAVDVGHGNTDVTGSGTLAVHAGGCRPPRPARPRPVCGTRTTWRFHPLSWMTLVGSFPAWSWLAERPASG